MTSFTVADHMMSVGFSDGYVNLYLFNSQADDRLILRLVFRSYVLHGSAQIKNCKDQSLELMRRQSSQIQNELSQDQILERSKSKAEQNHIIAISEPFRSITDPSWTIKLARVQQYSHSISAVCHVLVEGNLFLLV